MIVLFLNFQMTFYSTPFVWVKAWNIQYKFYLAVELLIFSLENDSGLREQGKKYPLNKAHACTSRTSWLWPREQAACVGSKDTNAICLLITKVDNSGALAQLEWPLSKTCRNVTGLKHWSEHHREPECHNAISQIHGVSKGLYPGSHWTLPLGIYCLLFLPI